MNPRSITGALDSLFGAGLTLWYIQSQNIRVRPLVVAWAFSVLVVEMLLLWLVIYFVWHQAFYIPHRSLFALLTGKSAEYVPGLGNSNYLMPYFPSDSSLPGMVRYVFFFHGPESLALVVSFVSLLALDIKNRLWSSLLLGSSVFLLLLSATRSAWLALPVVLLIRWLLTAGKVWGPWLICAAIALTTFTTTAIPPVTNAVVDTVTDRAEAVGELRADSTEVRAEIYRRTWEGVLDASDGNLFFGHVVTGETVLPGYAPAMVGSHSFYLGNLLYRKGLLGTGIFLAYWAVLIQWFYKTRKGRPMCSKLVFVLFSLTFCVMEWESVVMPLILICATLREPRKLPNHHKATEAQRKSSKKVSKWS